MIWWISVAHALTISLPDTEATADTRDASGTITLPIRLALEGEGVSGCNANGERVNIVLRRLQCSGRIIPLSQSADLEADGSWCEATVHIPTNDLVPGDCSLDLVVTARDQTARSSQFTLRIPAPKLEVKTSPIRIERWGWWGKREDPLVINVTESSGASGVADLRADWIPGTTTTGLSTRGEVRCEISRAGGPEPPQPTALPRNATLPIACQMSGFEYGKVMGTVRFTGEPLSAPLDLPIEIKTIFTPWVIPIVIAIGLGCGFAVRRVLEPRIALAEATARVLATMHRIAEIRSSVRDPILEGDLGTILARLKAMIDARTTIAALEEAEKVAEKALTEAQDACLKRMTDLEARAKELTIAIDLDWRLPPATAAAAERARSATRELSTQVRAGNTSQGAATLSEAEGAAARLASELRSEIERLIAITETGPPQVAAVGKALRAAATEALDPTTDPLRVPRLSHALYTAFERDLPTAVEGTREALLDALAEEWLSHMEFVKNSLSAVVPRDPALALQALEKVIKPAAQTIRAKILDAARDAAMQARVRAALDAGEYRKAAGLFSGEEGLIEARVESRAQSASTAIINVSLDNQPTPAVFIGSASAITKWITSSGQATTEQTRRLRTIYYILVSSGILLITSVQTLPTWVGTPQEFLSLFGLALGLDLGSKLLFELANQVTKSTP